MQKIKDSPFDVLRHSPTLRNVYFARLRSHRSYAQGLISLCLGRVLSHENLSLPMLHIDGLSRQLALNKVRHLLNLVGLAYAADRKGNKLSRGERQRVAVARALANDPDILLADEPTGNLDFANSEVLFAQMQKLAHELNRTILIVTHNREMAQACDVCLPMRDGKFDS